MEVENRTQTRNNMPLLMLPTILCVNKKSIYKELGMNCYDQDRNAYTLTGSEPVICHPPCQQWSRLKHFAIYNREERDLAHFCLEKIHKNGGILEHPEGSSFFKEAGIKPTISIDQFWFGFPARKRTYLYFHGYKPVQMPLKFDAIEKKVTQMSYKKRSDTTKELAIWLIKSITDFR